MDLGVQFTRRTQPEWWCWLDEMDDRWEEEWSASDYEFADLSERVDSGEYWPDEG